MGWITNLDKEPLDFRYLNKECTKAVLQQPLVYDYNGLKIEVPEGFTCDGASIPRIFWTVAGSPLRGAYVPAAFIHDYLCHLALADKKPVCSWSDAHKAFYEAMLDNGCPNGGLKGAAAKYRAVQIGMFFRRWKYDG